MRTFQFYSPSEFQLYNRVINYGRHVTYSSCFWWTERAGRWATPWETLANILFRVPLGVDVQPAAQAEVGRKTSVQWDSRGLTQQAGPQGQEGLRTGLERSIPRSPEWRNQPSRPNFIFSPPPVDLSGVCFILALLHFTCTPEWLFEKIIFWKNNWISNLAHHWWLPHGARFHFILPLFYCVFPQFLNQKNYIFFSLQILFCMSQIVDVIWIFLQKKIHLFRRNLTPLNVTLLSICKRFLK